MACCRRSILSGEVNESAPFCEMCGQQIVYCSDEKCSTQECALSCHGIGDIELAEADSMDEDLAAFSREGVDYFGLADSGWTEEDLRSLSRKGPRGDPFY
jgi:hypothetical protein